MLIDRRSYLLTCLGGAIDDHPSRLGPAMANKRAEAKRVAVRHGQVKLHSDTCRRMGELRNNQIM